MSALPENTLATEAGPTGGNRGAIARYFDFAAEGTNYRREILGGVTTFLAMAYILFVNPAILADAGMPKEPLFVATALSAVMGCLFMAFIARYPVGQAPSMGVNAYFAYTVVLGMGETWQVALVASLIAGVLFVILTAFKVREKILDAIPRDLKLAMACGIGLFIAFVGLQAGGIVVLNKSTLVTLGNLGKPTTLLSIFGLFLIVLLELRRVWGAIFFGMMGTALAGVLTGVIPTPTTLVSTIPSLGPLFGVAVTHIFDFPGQVFTTNMLIVVLTFLFVSFFDTAGTLIGVAERAGLMENNRLKREGRALFSDSLSIVTGAIVGTSPTNAYIESTTGIDVGARTGFSAFVTAVLFLLALFFSPLLTLITANVTAPAMIMIGTLMLGSLGEINWKRIEIALPAFVMMVMMAFTYNIANGIALGLVIYPVTMVIKGRARELPPIMYGMFIICVLYFAFLT